MYWGKDGGFFLEAREGAIQITIEEWRRLLEGQSEGFDIQTVAGRPELVKVKQTEHQILQDEVNKAQTYLDETDYMVIRSAEKGESFAEKYAAVFFKRRECRERINQIRKQIEKMGK